MNFILAQYPAASFEYEEYALSGYLESSSITLKLDNSELSEIESLTIYLYADSTVIKFTEASFNVNTPFEFENFFQNTMNNTLMISTYGEKYSGVGGNILDIEFDIVGNINDSSLIEFIRFEIDSSLMENTSPANIILIDGINCNNPVACNYNEGSSSDNDCILILQGECDCAGTLIDECGVCGGDGYASNCEGTDDCLNMDCAGYCQIDSPVSCMGINCGIAVLDECGLCDGDGYASNCEGTDDCLNMDCAGTCNGADYLTSCGDCSDDSNCNFSIGIATMDNNFRSDNIKIPLSLNNFNFVGFSQLSPESNGFEGMAFTVNFDPELLEINVGNSIEVLENLSVYFSQNQPGQISVALTVTPNIDVDTLYQSLDGEIGMISFDILESRYVRELHEYSTDIEIILTSLNGVDLSGDNLRDTGTLTIYTKACIDPFASTIDSNFICDIDDDVCDANGIIEGSHIFNFGCILPEPDFGNILDGRDGLEGIIKESDTYTLLIPEGTDFDFPGLETSLDIISSPSLNIEFLPDVAPDAQLAGSLVGLYPFGTTFNPPIEFRFTFNDLSRGTSEYKLLYMDDIETGDWEERGTCSVGELGFCRVEDLSSSGLFIVMYGENLEIDEVGIPSEFNLYRSYPNPFNPTTTLEFDVANSGLVSFTVYNVNGQIIELISSSFYTPGKYQIKWEARDIPSGIYLVQMRANSSFHLQKVMLLK